ncbi:lipid II-degrading bacteriocin [Burkholderia stagnalis]|uniref:lipid II-degrading bacteriocin n=2 Tax=Burkholderia stagnalis TaxID=1503054 RepID=UPI001E463BE4|nr:lipid II-degrading bacteriocin [Burkholderia stagnalis]
MLKISDNEQFPKSRTVRGLKMTDRDSSAPENTERIAQTRHHRERRRFLASSTALPLIALLKHSTCSAQSDAMPSISVTAPRLPSLDGFSGKVGGGGAMSEASLGYPKLLCFGRYCSATEIFNNADYGDMIATTEEFFQFLLESRNVLFWQNQLTLFGEFTGWLARGGYKHFPGANSYNLNVALGHADVSTLFGIYANQLNGIRPISEFQLYGSPFMFIGAVYYWVFGNGERRSLNLESMNLRMGVSDFELIRASIDNPGYGAGTYPIDGPFSTNVFSHGAQDFWSATTVGRVSGHVRGKLTMLEDNTYRFVGSYTLNPDKFDADRSNRPFLQEWMTTILREIGSALGHTDYQIYFDGEKEISFSGQRPVRNAETRPPQAVHRPSFGGLMRPRLR